MTFDHYYYCQCHWSRGATGKDPNRMIPPKKTFSLTTDNTPSPLLRIKLVTSRSLEMNGGDGAKERKLKDARERQIDDGVEM